MIKAKERKSYCFCKLVLALLLSTAFILNVAEVSIFADKATSCNNFQLVEEKTIDEVPILLYEHKPTGAKFVVEPNKTQELSLEVVFRTPTENNKGATHVLEHCIFNGSEKYPVKDLEFAIKKNYPLSDVGATTYHDFTSYKVSSLSESELKLTSGILLDSLFNPRVLKDKRIFRKEAFHYKFEDDVALNGVVYNEISNAYSSVQKSMEHSINENLFNGSSYKFDSGGTPWELPDLTFEDVINTHEKYYVPQNMLVVMKGNINFNDFFSFIDEEFLCKYPQNNNTQTAIPSYDIGKDIIKSFESEYDSPSQETCKYFTASYLLKDREMHTFTCASLFCSMCNSNLSDFRKIAKQKGYENIKVAVNGGHEKTIRFEYLEKQGKDLTSEKFSNDLIEIIKLYISGLTNNDYFDFVRDTVKLNMLNRNFMNEEKLNSLILFNNFTYGIDPIKDIEMYSLKSMEGILDEVCVVPYMKEFLQNNIINNDNYTVGRFNPAVNLNKSKLSRTYGKIQKLKSDYSEPEFLKQVEEQNRLTEWMEGADIIECFPTGLPYELKSMEDSSVDCEYIGNTKFLSDSIDSTISYIGLYFDLGGLNSDDLNLLNLMISAWWNNNFKSTTKVTREINCSTNNEDFSPHLKLSVYCLSKDIEKTFYLLHDLLMDRENLKNPVTKADVTRSLTTIQSQHLQNKGLYDIQKLQAAISPQNRLIYYADSIEYTKFLEELLKNENNLISANERLNDLVAKIFCKDNLYGAYCLGKDESIGKCKSMIKLIVESGKKSQEGCIKNSKKNFFTNDEAEEHDIVYNENTGSVVYAFDFSSENSARMYLISNILNYEYLLPKVRTVNGAYSVVNFVDSNGVFIMQSEADPNSAGTLEIFKKAPNFLLNWDCKNETLDNYKKLTAKQVVGANTKFIKKLLNMEFGINGENFYNNYKKALDQIFSTTKEDIKNIARKMEIAAQKAYSIVSMNRNTA